METDNKNDPQPGRSPSGAGGVRSAMIFAAGLGTRFKPFTDEHPKALAVINNKSLLQRNIEYLKQYGFTNVIVNVHHFAAQIEAAVHANNGWGSNILISNERDEVLETGGGLLKAKAHLINSTFLTINVDILTDADLNAMMQQHLQSKAIITLGVTNRSTSRYLLFDENNRLCGWRNTATGEEKIAIANKNYVQKAYSGLAIFEPTVFNFITQKGKFSLIDVFLSIAPHQAIMAFDHSNSKVLDVGKPESVAIAEAMFS